MIRNKRWCISLVFLSIINTSDGISQIINLDFLVGTWKKEGSEFFEHWDKLDENTIKGIAYQLKDNQINVEEYLTISKSKKGTFYLANVLNQNSGKAIGFKLTQSDSVFIFENPKHDFPTKIIYKKINDTKISIHVMGKNHDGFIYNMVKQLMNDKTMDTTNLNINYDESLAKKLGADDYGMKGYVLVLLKTGTNHSTNETFINNCFRGHMENIQRLVEQRKMIVAGPISKNDKEYRGIFILNTTNLEEAKKLLLDDTAIKEQILEAEYYNWYGSAALPEYLEFSEKIWKKKP